MTDAKTKWLYDNYSKLRPYAGQYIAHDDKGIVANHQHIAVLIKEAKATGRLFYICYIPENFDYYQINMLRLLPVSKSDWKPMYPVILQSGQHEAIKLEMLVDSGADISVISYEIGLALGLQVAEGEIFKNAAGIGGVISYALRQISFTIDGHELAAPVAWVQNQYTKDIILGREIVFDQFNVEFKQADEEIIFRKREPAI